MFFFCSNSRYFFMYELCYPYSHIAYATVCCFIERIVPDNKHDILCVLRWIEMDPFPSFFYFILTEYAILPFSFWSRGKFPNFNIQPEADCVLWIVQRARMLSIYIWTFIVPICFMLTVHCSLVPVHCSRVHNIPEIITKQFNSNARIWAVDSKLNCEWNT